MKAYLREFTKGIIVSNPLFILVLGCCPALAVTIGIDQSIAYSGGLAFVLLGTSIVVSSIRNIVPNMVRIPVFIVIVATFVTIVDITFEAYIPEMWRVLGIYLPLLVVNCIVLGRAEVFASKNPPPLSIADALGMTAGFSLAMLLVTIPRQLFGTGSLELFGNELLTLPVLSEHPISVLVLPPGAFLVIGLLLGLFRRLGVIKGGY
jgi:electron transport complex protein RnfE